MGSKSNPGPFDCLAKALPDETIDKVFAVMALAPQHTFQVLTKRAGRMRRYFEGRGLLRDGIVEIARGDRVIEAIEEIGSEFPDHDTRLALAGGLQWPLANVWLGVSVEDQERADQRIPDLIETPAAVRFLSCEPLLGPVDLHDWISPAFSHPPQLDWVIAGGESGPGARPMHPDWTRSLRDQCAAAGVAFFFKQWGEWASPGYHPDKKVPDHFWPLAEGRGPISYRVGKKAAGRRLDGRTHDEFPVPA